MKLGIIGTAGRGEDASLLTPAYYRMMCVIGQTVAMTTGATGLVSGGSAWADHCAVQLYLDKAVRNLSLHLPCEWLGDKSWFEPNEIGWRLNGLHSHFHDVVGVNPFYQILRAVEMGAGISVNRGGFKERNTDIANEADALLAFTFSGGPLPKDGGTRDTWDKFSVKTDRLYAEAEAHYQESPCGCQNNLPDEPLLGYHFDLSTRKMHRHEFWPQAVKDQRERAKAMWARVDPVQNLVPIARTKYEIENNLL